MSFLLLAVALTAASGIPGLLGKLPSSVGQWLSALLALIGGSLGIAVTLFLASSGKSSELRLPWSIPGAEFHVALDGLSVLFLLPVFLVFLLGSVYGLGYWRQSEHPDCGMWLVRSLWFLCRRAPSLPALRRLFFFWLWWASASKPASCLCTSGCPAPMPWRLAMFPRCCRGS